MNTNWPPHYTHPSLDLVPAPLPAQAPEERGKQHPDMITVNRFISMMEALALFPEVDKAVKFAAVCSDTTRRERDEAIRERDEARADAARWAGHNKTMAQQMEELRISAESAEARCVALEGELAEAHHAKAQAIHEANRRDQKWMDGIDSIVGQKLRYSISTINDPLNHGLTPTLEGFINELKKCASAPAWIPVSTPPTEEDADANGHVLARIPPPAYYEHQSYPIIRIHWKNVVEGCGFAYWLPASFLPPLPPTLPPEEETERKFILDKAIEATVLEGANFDGSIHAIIIDTLMDKRKLDYSAAHEKAEEIILGFAKSIKAARQSTPKD